MLLPGDDAKSTGLRATDLITEAAVGIVLKPLRTGLTILGIAVGTAALVATVGLAATAARSVTDRFDSLRAREVQISSTDAGDFARDVDRQLSLIPGVEAGGVLASATRQPRPVGTTRLGPTIEVPIVAATPGGLAATRPTITGRSFDRLITGEPVALVGTELARALGVVPGRTATLFIDGLPFTVVGIIESVERETALTGQVVVPFEVARSIWADTEGLVLIDVAPGAASRVATAAILALRPNDPGGLQVRLMPEARILRRDIIEELDALGVAVAVTVLSVAGLAVAAVMMLSVIERRNEIGLHRAIGARPIHIGSRFLVEAAMIGAVGGAIGTSAGVIVVAGSGLIRGTVPTLPTWAPVGGLVCGLLVALVAGAYPAYRAARLNPIDALR